MKNYRQCMICGRTHWAKGLCATHYIAQRRAEGKGSIDRRGYRDRVGDKRKRKFVPRKVGR